MVLVLVVGGGDAAMPLTPSFVRVAPSSRLCPSWMLAAGTLASPPIQMDRRCTIITFKTIPLLRSAASDPTWTKCTYVLRAGTTHQSRPSIHPYSCRQGVYVLGLRQVSVRIHTHTRMESTTRWCIHSHACCVTTATNASSAWPSVGISTIRAATTRPR